MLNSNKCNINAADANKMGFELGGPSGNIILISLQRHDCATH